VSEGTRTPDRRDHNPELYQLSYAHRVVRGESSSGGPRLKGRGRMPISPGMLTATLVFAVLVALWGGVGRAGDAA
jgi:hypothetical protein